MNRLALLWHLHQPDYRDPATGVPIMPWTRLHMLRGYRDVPLDVLRDGAPCTVNVVPSLLDQMLYYADGGADRHLDLTRRPAADLDAAEQDEIRHTFVAGNPGMIDLHAPYRRLAARVREGDRLDVAALRDLQIWSTLAWFGHTALRDFGPLKALLDKGSGFTEDDKAELLHVQSRLLRSLPAAYRELATSGVATISTTPYYHPILPLLVDTRHAQRCMPGLPDDPGFAWPGDALLQLRRARERVGEVLGVEPVGLWPSEGSVSPEVVELAGRAGYRWLATDEGILARSDVEGAKGRSGPWDLGHGVRGFFRDRDLSDRVGFQYAARDAREATAELLQLATQRAHGGVLLVALDGENPWEAFPDAGAAFREHLHRGLVHGPTRGVKLDEAAELPPIGRVRRLHTGSWINSDFGIWIGHPEDRAAWRELAKVRRAIDEAPEDVRAAALEKVLPAEGSDWFWWYGEDFSTPFKGTFDRVFRAHLRAAWEALGQPVPESLEQPIARAMSPVDPPTGPIEPRLDTDPSWVRWYGAGRIRWTKGASMAHGTAHVRTISYGWSAPDASTPAGALWLRIDVVEPLPPEPPGTDWELRAGPVRLSVPYGNAGNASVDGAEVVASARRVVARFDARRLPDRLVPVEVAVVSEAGRVGYPSEGPAGVPRPPSDVRMAYWSV